MAGSLRQGKDQRRSKRRNSAGINLEAAGPCGRALSWALAAAMPGGGRGPLANNPPPRPPPHHPITSTHPPSLTPTTNQPTIPHSPPQTTNIQTHQHTTCCFVVCFLGLGWWSSPRSYLRRRRLSLSQASVSCASRSGRRSYLRRRPWSLSQASGSGPSGESSSPEGYLRWRLRSLLQASLTGGLLSCWVVLRGLRLPCAASKQVCLLWCACVPFSKGQTTQLPSGAAGAGGVWLRR